MSFLKKLLRKQQQTSDVANTKTAPRAPKPIKANLGEVEPSWLEAIVESGSPTTVAVQKAGAPGLSEMETVLVTPDLARQALKAKQHEQRADNLAHSHRFQEAAKEYKLAIEVAPYEDEILHMSLGGVLSQLSQHEEAIHYLEIASQINPHNNDVVMNLAFAKKKAGKM